MTPTHATVRRCAIYVRISVATEESVSIERQIEAATKYAEARSWEIVGVFRDEGVSATKNKPEDRAGWKALLNSTARYDAVIVWKVDRLARRVLDFLNANEALGERDASIVAVEDPIDMTTETGVAFATMLAVFGQMEAATIRARVLAAQNHLLRSGRYVGGMLPYGYIAMKNPEGPGYVIVQDPESIDYVREMVRRTQDGHSVRSTAQYLTEIGAPTATALLAQRRPENKAGSPREVAQKWSHNAVSQLMRNPLLAGMVPGNRTGAQRERTYRRGDDVVRDDDGLPIVNAELAVMPVARWRAMQKRLDLVDKPQRRRGSMRGKTSGLLSGLMMCAEHPEPVRMHRMGAQKPDAPGRWGYQCPKEGCSHTMTNAQDLIVRHILEQCGDELLFRPTVEEIVEGGAIQLQEASVRLGELGQEVVNASPDRAAQIVAEITRLKAIQEEAKSRPALRRLITDDVDPDLTVSEAYSAAEDDMARRRVLDFLIDRIHVSRGKQGAWTDAAKLARLEFVWRAGAFGPDSVPTDEQAARWADEDPGRSA